MGLEEDRRFLVNDEDDLETVEAESDEPAIEENCLNVVYLSAVVAAIGMLRFNTIVKPTFLELIFVV